MLTVPCRVVSVKQETIDTVTLAVESPDGRHPAFAPGQFNMLYVFGVGEVPVSISSDSAADGILLHTVRNVGRITASLVAAKPGTAIGLRGPYGSHWPVDDTTGQDVVIVAGGLGLAPLRPALYHVLRDRNRYARVVLLYGARGPGELLFRDELSNWRGRFDLEVGVTVDSAGTDWRGAVGVVTRLIPRANFDPAGTTALVCGPEIMMRFTVSALLERGVSSDAIYLSLERNMRCAIGLCGHCQFGPSFICKDGPVFRYDRIGPWMSIREL